MTSDEFGSAAVVGVDLRVDPLPKYEIRDTRYGRAAVVGVDPSSFFIRHSSFAGRADTQVCPYLFIRHSSFVIRHSSFVTRHSSFVI
ncbi:MAG: hypothetical protein KJ046_17210, partial [Anaerolineae bacterium]|nr:hypothetical protein [Anaerolineae bacterium]